MTMILASDMTIKRPTEIEALRNMQRRMDIIRHHSDDLQLADFEWLVLITDLELQARHKNMTQVTADDIARLVGRASSVVQYAQRRTTETIALREFAGLAMLPTPPPHLASRLERLMLH